MLSPQFSLVRVTAPAALPISLAEAKEQMRVEGTDEDAIIQRLIDAAIAFVDVQGVLGRAMITQTWGQWLSPNPPMAVTLMLGPVQSVSAIRYYDVDGALQTATLADFNVFGTPNKITVSPKTGKAWPTTQTRDDAIQIQYVIGYGATSAAVPQTVRHALMMLVAHWYENREATQEKQMQDLPYGFMEMMNIERGSWYG
jgi:uncharacterized phiE125 gp8 family phage protein